MVECYEKEDSSTWGKCDAGGVIIPEALCKEAGSAGKNGEEEKIK